MTDEKETPPYVPSQRDQKDIERVMRFKDEAYEQTREERQEWRNSYFRYKLSHYLSEYDYVPDVQLALTYDTVERTATSLPAHEFGFRAKPTGQEDVKNALLFSEAMNHAWRSPNIMDGPTKMENVKKQMALFGNCFVQVYWETEMDEDGNVVRSDPNFWPLNIFDVYYNKFIPTVDELPEIGYQSIVSLQWLRDHGKDLGYKNIKFVKGFSPRTQGEDNDSSSIDTEEMMGKKKKENDLAKIFELQSDKEIITIAIDDNGPVFLRKAKNKLGKKNCVLFKMKTHPLPNRLLGVTDVAKGGALEDAIQRQMNQAVFNTLLVDNPNFTFDATDRNVDPRTFITAPGAGIPRGRNKDSVTPVEFPSHLRESLNLVGYLTDRFKTVVNTPDIMRGVGDKEADTATESNILDANSKATTEKIVDGMKASMEKVGDLMRRLYKEYGDESMTIELRTPELLQQFGEGGEEVMTVDLPSADFNLDRDIEITVDFTVQNKAILSRRIVEWLSITQNDPGVPIALRLSAYQKWLEFNDLDDLAREFQDQVGLSQMQDLLNQTMQLQQSMTGGAPQPGMEQQAGVPQGAPQGVPQTAPVANELATNGIPPQL